MAITKIHAIKSTLGKALAYIENPDKTDGQMLVSGYNCEPQTASIDFEMTAVLAHKARNLKRKRSTNLAYHLIQSFSPEDAVTPEQAHELGKKLAFEYTGGKYEYVVATHIDKGHIHNHIMINAVSFYDYKKLRTVPYRTARQIRDISDRLCMEAHLSVIDDPQKIGQLYPENAGKKKSVSNRTEIRKRLNFCLERATDYSQFLSMAKGLEITPTIRGKHISYLLEGAGQSVRDNSLSDTDTFTYAGICARLSDNAQEQKYLRKTITGILRSATGMADFADKLKTAGIETKVKKATGQVLYRATVLDGAWVPEDALGSEFTSEGIEYALKNGKMQITEDAEITLLDRYQKLTIQYPEVCTAAVKLSSRQILSAGKNGLVLQAHDDNGNPAKLVFRTVWKENAEDILGLLRMLDANLNTTGTPNDGNQLENKLSALNEELDDLVSQRASRSITMDDFLSRSTEINNEIINVEGLLQSSIQEQRPKARLDMHSIEAALSDDASFPDGKIEPGFLDRYANRIVKSNNRYIWMLQLVNVQQIMPIQSERQPIAMITYKSGVPYDIEQEQIGKQDKESAGPDCATICRPQDFFLNMGRTKRKRKLVEWLESCQENQVSVLDEKIPLLSFAVDFVTAYEYQKARGIKIHPGLWKDMRVDIFLVKKEN